jgi:predicted patatin/cPLA2 family phospholipase
MWTHLIISGGGFKGIAYASALYYIQSLYPHFQIHLTHYSGTSIGSLIVTLFLIGYSAKEILYMNCNIPSKIRSYLHTSLETLQKGGLFENTIIYRFIQACFIEKHIKKDITFQELHALFPTRHLMITGFNIQTLQTEYFQVETTPHMEVAKAIQISCCVPGLFRPVFHGGFVYVDGGVRCNFPVQPYVTITKGTPYHILGITSWIEDEILDHIKEPIREEEIGLDFFIQIAYHAMCTTLSSQHASLSKDHYISIPKHKDRSLYKEILQDTCTYEMYVSEGAQKAREYLIRRLKEKHAARILSRWFKRMRKDKHLRDWEVFQEHQEHDLSSLTHLQMSPSQLPSSHPPSVDLSSQQIDPPF